MVIRDGGGSPQALWWRPQSLRLRLVGRDLWSFVAELLRRPLAFLAGVVLVVYLLGAIFAAQLTAHDPTRADLRARFVPPLWAAAGSLEHPLGTDDQGRDLLARIIFGARASLAVGILAVSISVTAGTALGCVAGYYGGRLDQLISRFADLLLAFPFLIFAIGVMAFLGPGFLNLILALTFKGWVEFFRLARGEMLSEKTKEYVEAAKVAGQGHAAIILSEMLPNIVHSLFVLATLRMGDMIITEASLSFLGLGIQPPTPAWGSMVAAGRDFMFNAWWVSTLPGLALVILVLSINLLGEGLRDILDPRLKVV